MQGLSVPTRHLFRYIDLCLFTAAAASKVSAANLTITFYAPQIKRKIELVRLLYQQTTNPCFLYRMIKGNSFFQVSLLDAHPDWSAANLVMLAIPTVSAVVAGAGLHQRPELPLYHLQQESSSGWHFTIASCEQKDNFDRVQ